MKKTAYKQCVMRKKVSGSIVKDTAWIPEIFAVKNKSLDLKIGDSWDNGWIVSEVGKRMLFDETAVIGVEYRDHRKITDVHKRKKRKDEKDNPSEYEKG